MRSEGRKWEAYIWRYGAGTVQKLRQIAGANDPVAGKAEHICADKRVKSARSDEDGIRL
jgi:hypothetical protein